VGREESPFSGINASRRGQEDPARGAAEVFAALQRAHSSPFVLRTPRRATMAAVKLKPRG